MNAVKYEKLIEKMKKLNPYAKMVDGFDNCIVAIAENNEGTFFVYDVERIVSNITVKQNMSRQEALAYYEEFILGAQYATTGSPVFIISS